MAHTPDTRRRSAARSGPSTTIREAQAASLDLGGVERGEQPQGRDGTDPGEQASEASHQAASPASSATPTDSTSIPRGLPRKKWCSCGGPRRGDESCGRVFGGGRRACADRRDWCFRSAAAWPGPWPERCGPAQTARIPGSRNTAAKVTTDAAPHSRRRSGPSSAAGRAWTDSGDVHDDRGLKHRSRKAASRAAEGPVPATPRYARR